MVVPKEKASPDGKVPLPIFRIFIWGVAVLAFLALALVVYRFWLRQPTVIRSADTPVPFRPRVTYASSDVAISNTEEEPYLDTSLNLYVGAIRYSLQIGTINPGETVTRPLASLTNENGESFTPRSPRTSELEVRARFRGYDVHRDFPRPP